MRLCPAFYTLVLAAFLTACNAPGAPIDVPLPTISVSSISPLPEPSQSISSDGASVIQPEATSPLLQTSTQMTAVPDEQISPTAVVPLTPAITEARKQEKADMQNTLTQLKTMTPGVDYAEHEIIAMVGTQADAEAIAAQYGMTLSSFNGGIALFQTNETVLEIITRAADTDNDLPPVYPNYIRTTSF